MRYFKSFRGDDYYIPTELEEEFLFYTNKIIKNADIPDHIELFRGCVVAFDTKFAKYQVKFRRGQIWYKKTESWMGNDEKGSRVKISSVDGSFILYRKTKRIFGLDISIGQRYCLNKFSMLRIYEQLLFSRQS